VIAFMLSALLCVPSASDTPTLEAAAGTPFSFVRGSYPVADWLGLGPRVDVIRGHTLRTGLESSFTFIRSDVVTLAAQVLGARAFGFTHASSWDAEVSMVARVAWSERWSGELRAGAIGYMGGVDASQNGVLGVASGRVLVRLDAYFDLGLEGGGLADVRSIRPLGAVLIVHRL
jgi:hypothetical protein